MQKKVMALCLRVQFFLANPVIDSELYLSAAIFFCFPQEVISMSENKAIDCGFNCSSVIY